MKRPDLSLSLICHPKSMSLIPLLGNMAIAMFCHQTVILLCTVNIQFKPILVIFYSKSVLAIAILIPWNVLTVFSLK